MSNIKHLIALTFTMLLLVNGFAQEGYFYQFKQKSETKIRGKKIYFKPLQNTGKELQMDINALIEENLNVCYSTYSGIEKKKIQNHISWTREPMFEKLTSESGADVVVSGTYYIKTDVAIEEKLLYERQSNVGGALPYYEIRQTNMAEIQVIITYTYSDKSSDTDTIFVSADYERKPDTKYKSVDDLLKSCESKLKTELYHTFYFYEIEHVYYKFLKVKTSDKALKEEIKLASDLLANGEIKKLGSIYLRIYNADNSNKEAAFCLAMCYELLGNYPQAEKYYAIMPDFHVKVRMKENMKLYNYLISIGANMPLTEIE